jgi:hypothetical protein
MILVADLAFAQNLAGYVQETRTRTRNLLAEVPISLLANRTPDGNALGELFVQIGDTTTNWMNETLSDGQQVPTYEGSPVSREEVDRYLRTSGERLATWFRDVPDRLEREWETPWGEKFLGLERVFYLMLFEVQTRGEIIARLKDAGMQIHLSLPW